MCKTHLPSSSSSGRFGGYIVVFLIAMPVKRGLVAPQNIFIQTIIKKFDGSPDRNFVLGNAQVADLPIIYCNDGFCELTGYSRAELVQKHCSCDFLCGENTNEFSAREVKEALRGQEEKHVEILYYRKDGTSFLCSVLIAPVRNEEGTAVMYIINHEDVTWSPDRDEVTLPKSCFQFPLQVNRIPAAIRRKKKEYNGAATDEDDNQSAKSSRDPETFFTYTSSGTSEVESPSFIPVMSVHPPTPTGSVPSPREHPSPASSPEQQPSRKSPLLKSSSLDDMSKISKNARGESESLIKPVASPASNPGNMLYIPELKGRLSAAVSESSLWNSRNKPWLDGTNMDFRGSTLIASQGLQQLVHPRKTEKVAQVMSLGADVLPEYKLQAPKIHPWTILHYSPFKAFWDWLVLFLVIYTAIVTPYVASFILTRDKQQEERNKDPETRRNTGPVNIYSDPLVIVDYIVDVMFIVDIFINFRTTFVDANDEVVSHPCRIAVHYCKTWFVIDLVAAIPFELLIMIGNTDQTTTLIGLLKTARLLRLVRVARKLDHYSEYGISVLLLLMCSFALLAHWLACIWYFIGNIEHELEDPSTTIGWLDSLATQINQPYNKSDYTSGPDLQSKYITALYFTLSSLTSVGFGNVSPNTNTEKIFSICVMLIGSLFYAAIFGNVAAIIARLYSTTSRYHAQMQKVREFIRFYQIPSPLRQRVEDYAHHVWSYTNGIDMEQVLKHFPECLQADICLHLNASLLQSYPAFTSAPLGCLRAFALRIKTTHLPPGDYIIYQGDEVNHLYFVIRGTVEVLSSDVIMAILGKGDSFGENFAIDPDRPVVNSNASIRALTYCELRLVTREDVLHILKQYPLFKENFIKDLEITYNLRGDEAEKVRETIYTISIYF
ncbi:potassium voltage-gated channel subfamily H member 6-like [Orbicella faveolata]|uniref:potassium voltage-gated channel subfamily H member 6-like n=1 Tax=Orbicella faveolata TaxID=48498 RepID=UPI0009E4CA08|nr:potassium voltage-gated channel subfamily H member 6-like [Orbicella faveolata]